MTASLTTRQSEILDFIRDQASAGNVPTIREIGKHCGIRSPNGVTCHLKALKRKGLVSWEPKLSRSLRASDGDVIRNLSERYKQLVKAIARGGLDISACNLCGEMVVCVPDGQPMCEDCSERELS